MTDQNSIPDAITTRSWIAMTSVGLGLAFFSFIPGMLVMDLFLPPGLTNMGASTMPEALDPEALPAWLDLQTYRSWYRMHLAYHVVALAAFGSILGWFQSRLLRRYVPPLHWVGATAMGFVAILFFEIVERHIVVGPHGGPVEPLMISIGGSSIAGLAQWLVLRRRGVRASRWLAFWLVGVVVGVASRGCHDHRLGNSCTGADRTAAKRCSGASCALGPNALDAWLGYGRRGGGDKCARAHLLARYRDI